MDKKIAKVFRLNDYDHWAGYDLESVKEEYLKTTGMDPDEAFDEPMELTAKEMEEFKHAGCPDDPGGRYDPPITFKEELDKLVKERAVFPVFFASTEY